MKYYVIKNNKTVNCFVWDSEQAFVYPHEFDLILPESAWSVAAYPYPDLPVQQPAVIDEPSTVTKKQFFDWLIANKGYDMDDVINMVAVHITDPIELKAVKNAIKNALVYKKDDPNVAKIALMLGMSDLIDTIFEEAAGL